MKILCLLLIVVFVPSAFAGKKIIPTSKATPDSIGYLEESEAAKEALFIIFENSKSLEYGGCIYFDKTESLYHFTRPETNRRSGEVQVKCVAPIGTLVTAIYHSHPYNSEKGFSPNDVKTAKRLKLTSYIGCANSGEFRQFVHHRDRTKPLRRGRATRGGHLMSDGVLLGRPF